MSLREHVYQLRARWQWIIGGLALGLLFAGVATALTPTQYAATAVVYLSPGQSNNDPIAAYQGSLFTNQRMKSYAQLVSGDRVARDVVDELGLQESVGEVAQKLSATAQPDTVVLRVMATDGNPAGAADLANAAATSLGLLIPQLERPPGEAGPIPVTIQVVQPAVPPSSPVAPNLSRNLALGALGGLLAGLGAAALRSTLDHSVRSTRTLQDAVSAPVLGVIPLRRARRRTPGATMPAEIEAYRRVRTNLHHAGIERGVVLVTSAVHGEGRSTMVCNLAAAMGAGGSRVLVLDADLRNPGIAGRLDTGLEAGLTDVLAGRIPVTTAIWAGSDRSFDVIGSGPVPLNPSELLGSQQLADLLEELGARYDVVLLDSPPLLEVTDGAELAALADATIMICRYGRTDLGQLRAGADSLAAVAARLVGAVLTMVPDRGSRGSEPAAHQHVEGQPATAAQLELAGTLRPHRVRHRARYDTTPDLEKPQPAAVPQPTPASAGEPNHHAARYQD
jgi:capsular exopolysaccharide synthesis family protein